MNPMSPDIAQAFQLIFVATALALALVLSDRKPKRRPPWG